MRTWQSFWHVSSIVALIVVFCFSAAVGFSQSVQRALLMFIVLQVLGEYFGSFTKVKTISWIWVVQCVLFPVNVFSVSMLLTWFGSLNLTANRTSHFRKSVFYIFAESVKIQSIFFLISLSVFGAASVWSILANLTLLPVFSLFLICDFIIMIGGSSNYFTTTLIEWQMDFLSFIRNSWSYLSEHHNLILTFNFDKNQAAIGKKLLITALLALVAAKIIKNVEDNEKDLS